MKREVDVCIISQSWEPDVSGDVTRLRRAVDLLCKNSRSVTLITGGAQQFNGRVNSSGGLLSVVDKPGLRVVRLRTPALPYSGLSRRLVLYLWFCFGAIPLAIAYGKAKYVWAFSQRAFSTYTALASHVFWGSQVVSDVTDIWPEALVNTRYASEKSLFFRFARVFALTAYRSSGMITTLVQPQKRILMQRYGISSNRIRLVPNVSEPIAPCPISKPFVVLYYGNLGANYDFIPLIEAAGKVRSEKIHFVIKGDGEKLSMIARLASEMSNVSVITDVLNIDELGALKGSAGALVLPMAVQQIEDVSFPIKFVEYLWCGKPILYIGNGYPMRLILENKAGIAFSKQDSDALAAAITMLSDDEALRDEYGRNAREIANKYFSTKAMEMALLGLFPEQTSDARWSN